MADQHKETKPRQSAAADKQNPEPKPTQNAEGEETPLSALLPAADWSPRAWAVLAIFLLSGFSALIYQIVWMRQLTYVFGATIYAVVAVVAAYMGGLGLGSWLAGRRADSIQRPLKAYAYLELIIGVAALAFPILLGVLLPIIGAFYGSAAFGVIRFVVAFLLMMVPTTCMGATLPILSRWAARRESLLGLSIGRLYSANTFGAVSGVVFAGFFGISALTVFGTLLFGVAINVAIFVVSLRLDSTEEAVENWDAAVENPEDQQIVDQIRVEEISDRLRTTILWVYAGSGLIALAYQIIWFRMLVFPFEDLKNTTYAFSAMLATFLVGLAAGGAVGSKAVDTLTHPARAFSIVQVAIGVTGIFSLFLIFMYAPAIYVMTPITEDGGTFFGSVVNLFAKTIVSIFLPTFFMGLSYPIAVKAYVGAKQAGRKVANLYAFNTGGAILGSLLCGFVFIPIFGLSSTFVILGLANIALAIVVMSQLAEYTVDAKRIVAAAGLVIGILIYLNVPGGSSFIQKYVEISSAGLNQVVSERIASRAEAEGFPVQETPNRTLSPGGVIENRALLSRLAYVEGPMVTAFVEENSIGDRTVMIDNVGVAGTDKILLTDQKSLAHIPTLMLDDPKSALTVGFGSGGASYSFLLHPGLEEVHCVEISKEVTRLAPFLKVSNKGFLDDTPEMNALRGDRFEIILDDARSYLRFAGRKYDIIATDCTDLRYKTNANLYDLQYFRLCREALTDEGMVCVWMPLAGLSEGAFLCALRTFVEVFPNMQVFYMNNYPTHYILLLGTKSDKPITVDVASMRKKLKNVAVRDDLAEIHLHQLEKILSCFVTDAPAFAKALDRAPAINTENNPYLEFKSPLYGYGDQPLIDNLNLLYEHQVDIASIVEEGTADADFISSLTVWSEASRDIVAGHHFYRQYSYLEAAEAYMAAWDKNPTDSSVKELLRFHEVQRVANNALQPDAITPVNFLNIALHNVMFGEILILTGQSKQEAVDYFGMAVGIIERANAQNQSIPAYVTHTRALVGLGQCRIDELDKDAKQLLKQLYTRFELDNVAELEPWRDDYEAFKKQFPDYFKELDKEFADQRI